MSDDIEPPSYDHAVQSDQVFQLGKYKDATLDSYERGEMFIQAFSSQLDTFPSKQVEEIKERGFLSAIRIDDQTQKNELYQHPSRPYFSVTGHLVQFWPQAKRGTDLDATAQATHPFLSLQVFGKNQLTHHYFEIIVQNAPKETVVAIGLTTRPYPIFRMPGWNKFSVGYHSDDGHTFCDDATGGQAYGPSWGQGDIIGCGYCPESGQVYFTKNGQKLAMAFSDLTLHYYFPSVGVDGPATIQVNFGQFPFQYQIQSWAGQFI